MLFTRESPTSHVGLRDTAVTNAWAAIKRETRSPIASRPGLPSGAVGVELWYARQEGAGAETAVARVNFHSWDIFRAVLAARPAFLAQGIKVKGDKRTMEVDNDKVMYTSPAPGLICIKVCRQGVPTGIYILMDLLLRSQSV